MVTGAGVRGLGVVTHVCSHLRENAFDVFGRRVGDVALAADQVAGCVQVRLDGAEALAAGETTESRGERIQVRAPRVIATVTRCRGILRLKDLVGVKAAASQGNCASKRKLAW